MKLLKKIILVLLFLFPISNSFGAMVTEVQNDDVENSTTTADFLTGIHFNKDGTKMFTLYQCNSEDSDNCYVNEYNLSTPFDISTKSYAGDDERCELDHGLDSQNRLADLEFSSDGMKLFTVHGDHVGDDADDDNIYRFDLTSPFDISTCTFNHKTTNLDSDTFQDGSNAGDFTEADPSGRNKNRAQGFEINEDGTKVFVVMMGAGTQNNRLLEYQLSTPYDLTTMTLITNAGINLTDLPTTNVMSIRFSANGKRLFGVDHNTHKVYQISLGSAYDTSSYTLDGIVNINSLTSDSVAEIRAISFNTNGLKLYIGNDRDDGTDNRIYEFDLVCPFNIITGKCPSITENSDRTGMAEAQIELAKRSITLSTNSALNRLKWIRRNKDKQNLSNQNVKLNFSNSQFHLLKKYQHAFISKSTTSKNNTNSNKNYFYWSEGSVSLGRVGDTSIASTKEVHTNSLTFGYDRFTDDYGISGLAFRYGNDDVDVGTAGSNLDSNTYNITYYSTSPIKDDTKYVDKIFGIGKIRSDILTVLDGKNLTADRTGNQIYGTLKIKDEYKKDNLILIPSGQFDFGHTILNGYQESGTGAIIVEDQHVRTKNLRATMAIVEDLSNDKYTFKRHGKFEYVADIDRSSNFKYRYVSDSSSSFNDTLHTGALHNLNGEIGFDIIFPEHYSIFVIYERNHAFGSGYTDNIHIALGYLPYKDTKYAFSVDGSDNLMSQFEIKKNIYGYDFSFNLKNDLTNLGNDQEASINLNKVF